MIFDPVTGALFTHNGKFLKTVNCPLALTVQHLRVVDYLSKDRFCPSCSSTIRCLDQLSDTQAEQLIDEQSDTCVFATEAAEHIIVLHRPIDMPLPRNIPSLRTARTLEAMQLAALEGYQLVFEETGVENDAGEAKYILYYNKEQNELWWSGDYRNHSPPSGSNEGEWLLVKNWFWVRPDRPMPVAAYVVPRNLPTGCKVFVPDVIREIRHEYWNQGDSELITSAVGTWTGEKIEIPKPNRPAIIG